VASDNNDKSYSLAIQHEKRALMMKKQIYYILAGLITLVVFIAVIFTAKPGILVGGEILSGFTIENARQTPNDTHTPDGMVLISGGVFQMGMSDSYTDEAPVHTVKLTSFLLDRYEVTNRQFVAFVEATGYITQAMRDGYAWGFLKGASDFQKVSGANWRHPKGHDSNIEDRMDHPVVCVSWQDANEYAQWTGKRLPTEAEWEYAARAGSIHHFKAAFNQLKSLASDVHHHMNVSKTQDPSPSAKAHHHSSEHQTVTDDKNYVLVSANFWQGSWSADNQLADGYYYTAPVGRFTPNEWELYDMLGNVWEWTADWYSSDYYQHSPPQHPAGPANGENRVARGGSWFCSADYCGAYNTSFRGASPANHAFNNVGFRCAADITDQNSGDR
jgi:formylglycine-generating enzyme required for sulfatase activity